MSRVLTVVLASLAALVVVAPAAAQGTTKYRYWQDRSVSGPSPGRIVLAIAYEDRNGNGKFKPRFVASYNLEVQASCDPGGETDLELGGNAFSKYSFFKGPLTNGRFAHRFENQFEQPEQSALKGDLNGRLMKKVKQGKRVVRTARVDGAFDTEGNCTSSASYSATQCKRKWSKSDRPRWWEEWKAPVCTQDPW